MPLELNPQQNPIPVPDASETSDGLMSAADKIKLDALTASPLVILWPAGSSFAGVKAQIDAARIIGGGIVVLTGNSTAGAWVIDNSGGATVNFNSIWFVNNATAATSVGLNEPATITVNSGVTLVGNQINSLGISWNFLDTFCATTGPLYMYLDDGQIIASHAINPAFVLNGVGAANRSQVNTTGAVASLAPNPSPVFSLANSAQLQINAWGTANNSLVTAATVKVPNAGANAVVLLIFDATNVPVVGFITGTQVTLIQNSVDLATGVSYTPTNNVDWNNNPPNNVAAALNRIAAKITPVP